MKKRVADYLAEAIAERGVKKVFLLSGGGIMHLLDGLTLNKDFTLIFHHHEQCAGIAAETYARMIGSASFCFATSGPGATNIVTSIAGAWLDSSPVVYITGQSKTEQTIHNSRIKDLRQFGTFEIDIIEIVKSITKFSWFLDKAEDIPYVFDKACSLAESGRPGPVLIDIPVDVQGSYFESNELRKYSTAIESIRPNRDVFEKIIFKWESARRPLILAGNGITISHQGARLMEVARLMETPVVTTQMGKDAIPYDDHYWIGHPGIKGDRAGNIAIQNADFIIVLGASLHVLTTGYELDKFALNAWIAQVDLDRALFDRESIGVKEKCQADVKSFLDEVIDRHKECLFNDSRIIWRNELLVLKGRFEVYKEPHKVEDGRLNMYFVLKLFNKLSTSQDIIIADAGSAFYTVGQAWKVIKGQRILISGGFGSMGWAFPAATGAASSDEKRRVLCFTGDGSAITNLHELAVISKNRLNIKIIIFNNNGYLSIKNTQDNYFKGNYSGVGDTSGVFIPDFSAIAALFKIGYAKAQNQKQLEGAISIAFRNNGPFLIEALTNLNQEIIPTVSSKKLENGTMISMSIDNMSPFIDDEYNKIKKIL